MPRNLFVLFAVAALLLPAARASAAKEGPSLGVGARFTWENYKKPILAYTNNPGADITTYGGPNLGGHFRLGFTKRISASLGLDFGYFSHKVYPYPQFQNSDVYDEDHVENVTAKFVTFGLLIEGKLYFWDPLPSEAVLYMTLGIGKYFAKCGNDDKFGIIDETVEGDQAAELAVVMLDNETQMIGELSSPWIGQLAIGAEFWATKAFSIGADIIGFRFSFASTDAGPAQEQTFAEATWSGTQRIVEFYVYSAITMNFNLTHTSGGASSPSAPAEGEQWGPAEENWGGSGGGGGSSWGTQPQAAPRPMAQPMPQPAPQPMPPVSGWSSSVSEPAPAVTPSPALEPGPEAKPEPEPAAKPAKKKPEKTAAPPPPPGY